LRKEGEQEVWAKPLMGGNWAVVLFNRGEQPSRIGVRWSGLGLKDKSAQVRDLWTGKDAGSFEGGFSAMVPRHGVVMVRVK
jgi:alpha-galactosidase